MIGKARSSRLIDKYHVATLAPSVLVEHSSIAMLIDQAGTQFLKQSKCRGSSGATIEPECQWSGIRRLLGTEEPEEEVRWSNIEPTCVLGRSGITDCVILTLDANSMIGKLLRTESREFF